MAAAAARFLVGYIFTSHTGSFSLCAIVLLPHDMRRDQSSKARQRILAGRGPKKAVTADSPSVMHRIRVALNSTPSIFEPGTNFVVGWALIQAILLLYITIVVPFTAVYLSDLDCFPEWSICVDLIIDTYFMVDILVNAVRLFHNVCAVIPPS